MLYEVITIGIGMVKAFAHASGKPVLGVNTLDALAYNVLGTNKIVCPIIDARRGEVYTAAYENGRRISEYRAILLDDVLRERSGRQTVYLGDAAVVHKEKIV